MDIKPGSSNGGIDRFDPQRGQGGYTPRQAVYYSSRPTSPPAQPMQSAVDPTLAQSAKAAQRIVLPEPTGPSPEPVVNYAGSFDMIVPPKPTPVPQPTPVQPVVPVEALPVDPLPVSVPQAPVPVQFVAPQQPSFKPMGLPTDLKVTFEPESQASRFKKHSRLKFGLPKLTTPKVLVGMAVCLFVVGVSVSVIGLRTNKNVVAQVKGAQSKAVETDDDGGTTSGIPHEDGNSPSVDYYKTASTYPRVIRIPKNDTEARVLALAIAPTGALKAPGNIFDAGWYKDSARPGEAGAMVVDGHVSGPTKPGIFKNLGKLVKGDKIEIERGDGQKFVYTVQATKVFDADKLDMSSVMVPSVPGKAGLNIITCGGKFDKTTNKYEQRTVVYAVL